MIVGLLLAGLVGLSLGLLGGGGSILTVPILVYVVGLGAKEAIAASLVVVGLASLIGSISHWKVGNVNLRVAVPFGVLAMIGAFLGSRVLAPRVDGTTQLIMFAIVMLLAAISMLRGPKRIDRTRTSSKLGPIVLVVGVGVGILTGLVGVGGGFLIVPALVLLAGIPIKEAVGTSLLVIAMNSASGFAGYAGRIEIPWVFVGAFSAIAGVGIVAGAYLVRFVSAAALRRGFALFLLFTGGFILWQNRAALGVHRSSNGVDIVAAAEAT